MNQDLISRQAILKHIEKKRQDALMIDDLRESNIIMMGMKLLEEAVRIQPSAQPEHTETHSCDYECTETHDLISRQSAIKTFHDEIVRKRIDEDTNDDGTLDEFDTEAILRRLPSAQPQRWIPFRSRPLTAEEKEEHPEWDAIFESPLPDDGQRILVNIKYKRHEAVQMDEYYDDDGCYLDSGYEIGTEAVAWMPKPAPYAGD